MKSLLLAVLCLPVSAFADGGLPSQPYVYVAGNGEIQHAADMVTLRFKVGFRDRDQAAANKKTQKQANTVFALLDGEKIAQKDVVADNIESMAEYDENATAPEKHGAFIDYHVSRDFTIVVRDLNAFPKIADELLAMGLEEFSGIDASYSKEAELTEQARTKAIADARDQAEKELKGEQMKIDSVFTISSVPLSHIKHEIFQDDDEGQSPVFPSFSNGKVKFVPSQYRLAPISVSFTLHVIYLISPVK